MKHIYTQSAEESLRELGVDSRGLTGEEAQERLARYGRNRLQEAEKPTLLQRFLAQLNAPLDFFSWHVYAADTKKVQERVVFFRQLLDRYGAEAMWVDGSETIFYSPGFQDMIRT